MRRGLGYTKQSRVKVCVCGCAMNKHLLLLLVGAITLIAIMTPGSAPEPALAQTIVTVTPSPAIPPPVQLAQPSPTPQSALARETERLLLESFNRTQAVSIYQMTVVIRAAGKVAGANSAREELLVNYEGEYNGADSAYIWRTPDIARLGGDPAEGIAAAMVDGATYARGPLPIHGATEPIWYNLGGEPVSFLQPRYQMPDLVRRLSEGLPLSTFTRGRTETIDGRRCTAFQSNKDLAPVALGLLGRPLLPPQGTTPGTQFDLRITRGAVIVWHCSDGLLRRIQIVAAGNVQQQPSMVFASNITIELRNLNGKLTIAAPVDAQMLKRMPEPNVVSVRAGPIRSLRGVGTVLGQLNPQESVILIERSLDRRWYRVRASGATGWVSATLLAVPPAVVRQVPVAAS